MTHKCLDQSKERYMELAAHRFADSSIEVEDEEDIKQEEDTVSRWIVYEELVFCELRNQES